VLRVHRSGRRDICIGREHHVVVAASRNEYFIDPSHTDRLRFNASQADDLTPSPHGVTVRTLKKSSDADAMNRVLQWNGSLNRSELEVQFLEAPEQKGAVPLEPTIVCRTVLGL
jgi:hypothetical protein